VLQRNFIPEGTVKEGELLNSRTTLYKENSKITGLFKVYCKLDIIYPSRTKPCGADENQYLWQLHNDSPCVKNMQAESQNTCYLLVQILRIKYFYKIALVIHVYTLLNI